MSMRIMPLMQAGDVAIVPRSNDVCNFLDFCVDLFGLSHGQFMFYDSLDEDVFIGYCCPAAKVLYEIFFREIACICRNFVNSFVAKRIRDRGM